MVKPVGRTVGVGLGRGCDQPVELLRQRRAEAGRCCGSFARQRRTRASTSGGTWTSGFFSETGEEQGGGGQRTPGSADR